MKSLMVRLTLVLSVILVGLGGTAAFAQDDAPPPPVLGAINIVFPDLYVTPTDGQETRLIAASVFDPGDTLRTDEEGVALVTWFYDGTESALGQNSKLTLNAFSGDAPGAFVIDVELHVGHLVSGLGGVAADVSEGGVMTVKTPAFTVKALRGQFELIVSEAGETTLIVTEGRVEVMVGDAAATTVDAGQFVVGGGAAQSLSDDGVTPNLSGICTATTPTNLNIRLAPTEDSRRLGGVQADQVFWVRSATEGNLWLQVYYQTESDDEEAHNFGWVYGPAVTLDLEACAVLLHSPLDGMLYGGPGVDEPAGIEAESDPIPE